MSALFHEDESISDIGSFEFFLDGPLYDQILLDDHNNHLDTTTTTIGRSLTEFY
jgi:hypothetical protein